MDLLSYLLLATLVLLDGATGPAGASQPSTKALEQRIKLLEEEGKEQRVYIKLQERLLSEMEVVIHELKQGIKQQELRINELTERMDRQETDTSDRPSDPADRDEIMIEDSMDKQEGRHELELLRKRTPNMRSNVMSTAEKDLFRANRIQPVNANVVFIARMEDRLSSKHFGEGQVVVYDTLVSNIGAGYQFSKGVFVAPVSGVYIFSTSVMTHAAPHNFIEVSIMQNGLSLAGASSYSDGRSDQGSVTVASYVNQGDSVWVAVTQPVGDEAYIVGWGFSSFSGCLVKNA